MEPPVHGWRPRSEPADHRGQAVRAALARVTALERAGDEVLLTGDDIELRWVLADLYRDGRDRPPGTHTPSARQHA